MSRRFLIMLLVGVGLMVLMWIKQVEHEKQQMDVDLPTRGCAQKTQCPQNAPFCVVASSIPDGICANTCRRNNECPENWCCGEAPNARGQLDRCLPPELCGKR